VVLRCARKCDEKCKESVDWLCTGGSRDVLDTYKRVVEIAIACYPDVEASPSLPLSQRHSTNIGIVKNIFKMVSLTCVSETSA
jgi:hypothetical protein